MANRRRGEIEAVLDGRTHTLCLTLGALAELESAFQAENLMMLANRFEKGQLTSKDIAVLIRCGLKGAGEDVSMEAVMAMQTEGGLGGFVDIAKDLLVATFGHSDESPN